MTKTEGKISPKILLEKNEERENKKSEEKERRRRKKSNGCAPSFCVDFFGVFERKRLFEERLLFWLLGY